MLIFGEPRIVVSSWGLREFVALFGALLSVGSAVFVIAEAEKGGGLRRATLGTLAG